MPPRLQAPPQLVVNDPAVTKERLRPEARPTGEVRVSTAPGENLSRLADSILGLTSPLSRLASASFERSKQAAQVKGAEMASAAYNDIIATGKSIKAGELATTDSPWVRYYAREQFGGLMAGRMSSDFAAFVTANPIEDTDPAAWDKTYAQFRMKWLDENIGDRDPAFNTGFMGPADATAQALRNNFIAESSQKLYNQLNEGDYNVARHAATDWITQGTSPDLAIQRIIANNNASILTRPNDGKEIVRSTVSAIIDAANRNPEHAEEILGMLDKIPAGSGMMGDISWVVQAVTKSRDQALTRRSKEAAEQSRLEKQADRQATDDLYDGMLTALQTAVESGLDPRTVDLTPFATQAQDAGLNGPEVTRHMKDVVENFRSVAEHDDPEIVRTLRAKAVAGTLRPGDLAEYRGVMTEETYKELRTFMKDAQAAAGKGRSAAAYLRQINTRPELTRALSNVYGWFTSTFGLSNENRQAGINAKQRMEWDFAQWAGTAEGRAALSSSDPSAVEEWALRESFKLTNRDFDKWLANPSESSTVKKLDWNKEPVMPEAELNAVEEELKAYHRDPFNPDNHPLLNLYLEDNGLSIADADKFVETQRKLRAAASQ